MGVIGGINFDEPIPQMIERLKSEHVIFESKLVQVEDSLRNNKVKQAAEIIQSINEKITCHAVEEEARLMRVIMHKAKNESSESIQIMQEHNWVMEFLKSNLLFFEMASFNNSSLSSESKDFKDAKKNMNEFVINLRKHFEEEEQIVFPLTLRAEAAN
jgi:iron-sulfur cluster repair protein YtfE (RIC family)